MSSLELIWSLVMFLFIDDCLKVAGTCKHQREYSMKKLV